LARPALTGAGAPPQTQVALVDDAGNVLVDRQGRVLTAQVVKRATAQGAFDRRLSERPADIRDAARVLARAIRDQVEEWNASKPNDAEALARHDEFVAFLEWVAAGLGELADALDRAVAASTSGSPEPMFLGKAGGIVEQLNIGVKEWLERNRSHLAGYTVRVGVFLATLSFLHACGVGDAAATIASGLLNASFPRAKTNAAAKNKKSHK
jgi:hypothetical protein